MERNIRVKSVRRKEVDTERLALAFLLLARSMQDGSEDCEPEASEGAQ